MAPYGAIVFLEEDEMGNKIFESERGSEGAKKSLDTLGQEFQSAATMTAEDHVVLVNPPDKNRRFEVCDEALS